jgi:hypothetical protein
MSFSNWFKCLLSLQTPKISHIYLLTGSSSGSSCDRMAEFCMDKCRKEPVSTMVQIRSSTTTPSSASTQSQVFTRPVGHGLMLDSLVLWSVWCEKHISKLNYFGMVALLSCTRLSWLIFMRLFQFDELLAF